MDPVMLKEKYSWLNTDGVCLGCVGKCAYQIRSYICVCVILLSFPAR